MEAYLQALDIYQVTHDRLGAANTLNSLAFVYKGTGQYEKAIEILKEAGTLYEGFGNPSGLARVTFNIGLMTLEMNRHEQAIPYFRKAMRGLTEEKEPYKFSTYYNNMANCYNHMVDVNPAYYDSALYYGAKNLALKQQLMDYRGIANAHNILAATYGRRNEFEKRYRHALKALSIADSLSLGPIKRNALMYLVTAEIGLRKTDELTDHFYSYRETVEALNQQAHSETLAEMAVKYETEKKEAENLQLQLANAQQERLNWVLGTGGSVLVIVLALLTFSFSKLRKSKRTIELQSRELQKLNDLKSEFFANISHELRTPLTLINGQLESLQTKSLPPFEKDERIKRAKRNTRQLGQMIDDLLDLSMLELGTMQLSLQPMDIIQYTRRQVSSFQSLAESKKITLAFEADEKADNITAMIDTRRFEKVLNNLLYNAFKFTSPGGQTSVAVGKQTDQYEITVLNTGNPIPEGELGRLFDRFYQASNNDTNSGSGLGLAIAKEIVDLHHGSIDARNVNGGVIFTVKGPVSSHPPLPSPEGPGISKSTESPKPDLALGLDEVINAKLPEIASNKPVVLVVEDNEEMQAYVHEVLSGYFNLEKASNGKEAIEKLATLNPELIIADVMMPEMDGFELLEKLKKSAAHFNIPVMFLTALASQEDKLSGLRMGLDDYVVKPFDREELIVRVTNLIYNLRRRLALAHELETDEKRTDKRNPITAEDEKLIRKAQAFIESNIATANLSVKAVAESLGISERQLYPRMASIVGMTPGEYITEVKLQYARKLLLAGRINKLSQLTYELGYHNDSYFSNLFFQRFGKRPGDYIEQTRQG